MPSLNYLDDKVQLLAQAAWVEEKAQAFVGLRNSFRKAEEVKEAVPFDDDDDDDDDDTVANARLPRWRRA